MSALHKGLQLQKYKKNSIIARNMHFLTLFYSRPFIKWTQNQ